MGGAQKKKAIKFIKKGHLSKKLKDRNQKKRIQQLKNKRKAKFEDDGTRSKKDKDAQAAAAAAASNKKKDPDMMDDMDVDDFLNGEFLDSDAESDVEDMENDDVQADEDDDDDADAIMDDAGDESSSEEEDEDALDPRYLTPMPEVGDSDDEERAPNDDDDDEGEDDGADVPQDEDEAAESVGRTTLTMAMLIKAEKECFEQYTANGLRRLMKIFSDACRSSDAADVNKAGEVLYDIQSSAVYNRLMLNVFRKMHVTFAKLVASNGSDGDDQGGNAKLKVDERKWKKHSLVIKRFFSCVTYVLTQTTGQDIQTFVLRELAHYIPFLVPDPKSAARLLRALLKLWAKSLNNTVCMLSFVRIRDLALQMPFPFLETALKGIYITYMRNTKFTNEATLPHHILLGNCVVELYGLDMASSYQHAFVYIRELAITIRKTITSPGPETFKAVLNWQFFNQLRVWTAVICAYPGEHELKALVYPLCQLLFAVVRLASTIRYAPMRFQCVKLLQQIAFASNSFVPTSPVLLEILNQPPFSTSYRGTKVKGGSGGSDSTRIDLDLELSVKLSKAHLDNKRVHDLLISRLFELLQRECDVYKFHIGFPEFTVPLQLALSKFASACLVPRWKSLARGLIENLKKRADWIRSKRSGLDIAPKDIDKMSSFLKTEREAAVQKLIASDAEELKKKLAASPQDGEAKVYNSDDSDDEDEDHPVRKDAEDDDDDEEEEEQNSEDTKSASKKKKNRKKNKKTKSGDAATTVDDETFNKVKKMSLKDFKKSVAAVDAEDVVEDMDFSSDDE